MFNEKHLKTKIKSDNGKIDTNFYNNKIPKVSSQFICLSEILIESVFITGKNYYAEVFLEEYKYIVKQKECKMQEHITDKIMILMILKIKD